MAAGQRGNRKLKDFCGQRARRTSAERAYKGSPRNRRSPPRERGIRGRASSSNLGGTTKYSGTLVPMHGTGVSFLFGEFHRDTGRPFRGVRRGRLSTSPRRCEPFLRKSNANPQLPLGRCGHRPYAKSGEFLKRRRGGRLCPPGKTRRRNAKTIGEFAGSHGRAESPAPTKVYR